MIYQALSFTSTVLNQFIKNKFGLTDDTVVVNRIIDPNGTIPEKNQNKIVLSLIHVEEETTKQFYNRMQPVADGNYVNKATSNQYNLVTLMTPVFDDYSEGLKFLEATIQFFQINQLMDANQYANLPDGIQKIAYEFQKDENSLETQNLWTTLGAKYQPSVRYKMKMITIASDEIQGFDTIVNEIDTNQ